LLTGENSPLAKKNKRKQADTPITTGDNSPVLEPLDVLAGLNVSQEAREAADREDQREERRRQRSQLKAERIAPPLPTGAYRLLYADPPWRYEHVKTESRAIENQYPTMDLEAICQLEVPAADDAVLFLWATPPKLAEALQVIDAWGFTYRTCAVWDKEQIGMGYYFRQQHELLLVGARGEAPVPDAPLRLPSLFRSKRSEHSEKPTFVYGYLEAMYPGFTEHDRVELFNRDHRDGWAQWGNEPAEATP
jgi:N6-adenosine-specific RNA methylase IME4